MKKLSVIIPVFNEPVESVCEVIGRILNIPNNGGKKHSTKLRKNGYENLEVIVVDDGSYDFSDDFYFDLPRSKVKLLKKNKNEGKGSAIRSGVQVADGDILVFIDGDGEIIITRDDIHNAISLLDSCDLVIGVREFDRFNLHFLLTFVFSCFISKIVGKISGSSEVFPDVLCGFRVMRRDFFEKLNLKSKRYGVELELFLKTSLAGGKISSYRVKYRRKRGWTFTRKMKVALSLLSENLWFVPQFITKIFLILFSVINFLQVLLPFS